LEDEIRVLTTGGLADFIKNGGVICYLLVSDKPFLWEVWSEANGKRLQPVFVSGTGAKRTFKSASALVEFHRKHFPDNRALCVPLKVGECSA